MSPGVYQKRPDTVGEVARLNGSRAAHGRRPVPKGTACGLSAASHRLRQRYPSEWLIPLSPSCYPVLEQDRRDGAMTDFPRSLPGFERRFPDEAACAEWLLERRWGSGFACPACGRDRFWRLGRKVLTLQCRACRRETSVTVEPGHAPQPPASDGLVHRS